MKYSCLSIVRCWTIMCCCWGFSLQIPCFYLNIYLDVRWCIYFSFGQILIIFIIINIYIKIIAFSLLKLGFTEMSGLEKFILFKIANFNSFNCTYIKFIEVSCLPWNFHFKFYAIEFTSLILWSGFLQEHNLFYV